MIEKNTARYALVVGVGGWLLTLAVSCYAQSAAGENKRVQAEPWPFFAFDNGVGRDAGWTPQRQAQLLAELGYHGIGYSGFDDLAARLAACDAKQIRVFSYYTYCRPEQPQPCDPTTNDVLKLLDGSRAILWVTVQGKTSDEKAAAALGQLADLAAPHGVRVAVYPHHGMYVETTRHALRIVNLASRGNLGVSLNLGHELRSGNGKQLLEIVKESSEKLWLVSIHGADLVEGDDFGPGWSRLIQRLGDGSFDMLPLLRQLRETGYAGPVGLQCYQVPGDIAENLRRSLLAWQDLVQRAGLSVSPLP